MDRGQLYRQLYDSWRKAMYTLSGVEVQSQANAFWNQHRKSPEVITSKIQELNAVLKKRAGIVTHLFASLASTASNKTSDESQRAKIPVAISPSAPQGSEIKPVQVEGFTESTPTTRPKPAQDLAQKNLNESLSRIVALQSMKDKGLLTAEQNVTLNKEKTDAADLRKRLEKLKRKAEQETGYRKAKTNKLQDFANLHPEFKAETNSLKPKAVGRPSIESTQPQLLKTIIDIVTPISSADGRRRTEKLRACMTLDDLHKQLLDQGLQLSRSTTYLRLLPRDSSTTEGKRHISTVPVRLLRSENQKRKLHQDSHFAAATVKYLRDLVTLFGAETCFVLSQDDKARVPLGLPAAKLQSPILMHLEYKVTLPDHDWVVAGGHKLIPSVYAGLCFKDDSLSYSGPTYIAIRSGKHDSSTASSHAVDLNRLLHLENFQNIAKVPGGQQIKPIVMIMTDGGPDENPRFPKPMFQAIAHFKKFDLDCLFIVTHAPGYSAYNPVERRMAPLSHDLSGLILPHEFYGSHLDSQGRTMDSALEKKNFEKAGQALADVWSEKKIDNFDVVAEFVEKTMHENHDSEISEEWKSIHVRQSHYMLQITKCKNTACCKPPRSNYAAVFPDRFIPPPLLFCRNKLGISLCSNTCDANHKHFFGDLQTRLSLNALAPKVKEFPVLPFDYYCPSQLSTLTKRTCGICSMYFPSQVALTKHKKIHKNNKRQAIAAILPENDINDEALPENDINDDALPPVDEEIFIIENMEDWLQSPFVSI